MIFSHIHGQIFGSFWALARSAGPTRQRRGEIPLANGFFFFILGKIATFSEPFFKGRIWFLATWKIILNLKKFITICLRHLWPLWDNLLPLCKTFYQEKSRNISKMLSFKPKYKGVGSSGRFEMLSGRSKMLFGPC